MTCLKEAQKALKEVSLALQKAALRYAQAIADVGEAPDEKTELQATALDYSFCKREVSRFRED